MKVQIDLETYRWSCGTDAAPNSFTQYGKSDACPACGEPVFESEMKLRYAYTAKGCRRFRYRSEREKENYE